MAFIVHTRKLTISCFTSTHRRTTHRKLSNSYQIPYLKDCWKILPTKKFSIQRKLNTKLRYRSRVIMFDLKYTDNISEKPKTRKRNIILFNPSFSKSVSTNVAKTFLPMVTKHFPWSHKLHKIFNRNTVNVSYICMINMSNIIKGHNKKVISKPHDQIPKCNCRKKQNVQWKGTAKLTT